MLICRRRIFDLQGTFLKDPHFYKTLGTKKSLPAICNPVKHRIHRNILNPLFSKRAVAVKYSLVLEKVERAVEFVRRRSRQKAPIEVDLLFPRVAQLASKIALIREKRKKGALKLDEETVTVFDVMLESDQSKGFIVPEADELVDETFLFLVAGTAYMEIYTFLTNLFLRFEFEPYETDESNMIWLDKGLATNRATVKVLAKPNNAGLLGTGTPRNSQRF
ncbi:MAG: hypothetical protein Q9161_009372 [Pseudevernia consocians]